MDPARFSTSTFSDGRLRVVHSPTDRLRLSHQAKNKTRTRRSVPSNQVAGEEQQPTLEDFKAEELAGAGECDPSDRGQDQPADKNAAQNPGLKEQKEAVQPIAIPCRLERRVDRES